MAGYYETAGGVGISNLFGEKPPNLIPQAVMDAIDGKGTLVGNLFALNTKGYSTNVRRYYKYGLEHYLGGMPVGSSNRDHVDETALYSATTIEAKKLFVLEAARQETIAAELKLSLGELHPDYILAQEQADATLALSTNLKISYATTATEYPDQYVKIITYLYENHGLFITPITGELEGIEFLFNTPSHYPITKIQSIFVPEKLYFWMQNLKSGKVTLSYEDSLGIITTQEYESGYYPAIYEDPDSIYELTKYKVIPYLTITFTVEGIPEGTFTWVYDLREDTYPDIYKTTLENVNVSDILPIATIKRGKEFLDTTLDEEGNPKNELGRSAYRMLDKIVVDATDLQDSLRDIPNADDLEDAHVGFFINITSKEPESIRYNMKFFEALREYNGVFPEGDYHTDASLEEQDSYYEKYFPDVYGLSTINDIQDTPPFDYVPLQGHTYIVNLEADLDSKAGNTISFFVAGMSSIITSFIYKKIIRGSIGSIGTTTIFIEDETEGWTRPPVFNDMRDNWKGIGVGYIEYKEQVTATHYKLIRVHNPAVKFTNWWFGDTWASSGMDTFTLTYSLRDNTGGQVEDPKEMMGFPMLYNVIRTFSGISETKVYYDALSILMFTVVVEYIPAWKLALQIIFILVFAFLSVILAPVSIALAIISVITNIVTRLVTAIVSQNKGAEEGAIAGAGIGIAVAILTLGTNITLLLENVLKLVLEIIGIALNIVKLAFQAISLNIEKEYLQLIEDNDEEQERLESKRELYDVSTDYDPLQIGKIWNPYESADEYYTKRLDLDITAFVIETVYNFHEIALYLPEDNFMLDQQIEGE